MHPQIPFILAFQLSVQRFQMPLKGLNFVKKLATFGIIYAQDLLLQSMSKIVCLRGFNFDILTTNRL